MRARYTSRREPTIALINIVFLLLVFFLVAGTLAPPISRDLTLVNTNDLPTTAPPDALVVHADGRLSYRGVPVPSAAAYMAQTGAEGAIRVVPDRALPAQSLIQIGRDLQQAGAERVMIVTQRGLQ